MKRVWCYFFKARGRGDKRGCVEFWLYTHSARYRRFYYEALHGPLT